ncbi:MAG: thermonuclease family protein [Myxococcota bacterium]
MKRPDLSPDAVYWSLIATLAASSVFFALSVELRRRHWSSGSAGTSIDTGTSVDVLQVIDGDEVSVKLPDGASVVVRLLGVKAFDPKVNEPGLAEYGIAAVHHLEKLLNGSAPLAVEFEQAQYDDAGRLLAYLRKDALDIGAGLIEGGFAIAFTRYPFSREQTYGALQQGAKERGEGLWASAKASERAEALHDQWRAERAP